MLSTALDDPIVTASPTRRLRVLQLGATLAIGGSERLAAAIGRGLPRDRFEVYFAAIGEDGLIGDGLRNEGFTAVAFHRKPGFDFRLFHKIWRFVRRHEIDVVQSHHVAALIYGGLPARCAGAKLVHTEHDATSFAVFPRNLQWLRRLARLPHRFVAIDPSIADFLESKGAIDRRRIDVIRNGIELDRFHPSDNGARPPLAVAEPFVIGWVGRLDVPKRPDVLVEAAALLRAEGRDVRLVVVGPGLLLEPSRSRANALGLGDRVEWLGARTDIPEQLRRMNCCVLCSDREGLPFTLVEAMATGLPCIASAVGGIPHLLRDGHNGLLLAENDPRLLAMRLAEVIDRPDWARTLGEHARAAAVQDFDFRATIDRYARLFLDLAGSPEGGPRP